MCTCPDFLLLLVQVAEGNNPLPRLPCTESCLWPTHAMAGWGYKKGKWTIYRAKIANSAISPLVFPTVNTLKIFFRNPKGSSKLLQGGFDADFEITFDFMFMCEWVYEKIVISINLLKSAF